jgi:UDP-N-acetylmuramate dehydrogenase
MNVQNDFPMKNLCTMRIGGKAKYFFTVSTREDLVRAIAYAKENNQSILPLGDGSNTIFTDHGYNGVIIKQENSEYSISQKSDIEFFVKADAGMKWDRLVEKTVEQGLSGIEALSAIPGTVGAAPVQNIGAYGQELADTFIELEAYDFTKNKFVKLSKANCGFGYRNSIFKSSQKGRYIIASISLTLKKGSIKPPLYATLEKYMKENNLTDLSPATVRSAVRSWRAIYLPDPKVVANNGSFFGNPIVSRDILDKIKSAKPEINFWPFQWYWKLPNGKIKIAAGRLAEMAGLKDWHDSDTGMATWKNQALVFVNENAKSFNDLERFKKKYLEKIKQEYGITLEQEPETIT